MQPLSRVSPSAITNWGDPPMEARPGLAAKVAQCIARWSQNEVLLGAFLAFLLHANERAALAMYSGLENRSAQLRMIGSAAKATLTASHYDAIDALMTTLVRPAMRERDKLAHWIWGHSDELPDALLLAEPSHNLQSLMQAFRSQRSVGTTDVPTTFDNIFVVRDQDLVGIKNRGEELKGHLQLAMATVWEPNTAEQRASFLLQLSNVPQIRVALDRKRAQQST